MKHIEAIKECYSCLYARWTAPPDDFTSEPQLDCDPPMYECPAEIPDVPDYPPGMEAYPERWY